MGTKLLQGRDSSLEGTCIPLWSAPSPGLSLLGSQKPAFPGWDLNTVAGPTS